MSERGKSSVRSHTAVQPHKTVGKSAAVLTSSLTGKILGGLGNGTFKSLSKPYDSKPFDGMFHLVVHSIGYKAFGHFATLWMHHS